MADYVPPTQILPIFDSSVFNTAQNQYLTYSQATGLFLTFPTAQGDETLQNITVDGVSKFNGALVMPDGSTQSSAYTGAGIANAGSYVSTNLTLDANGKISAISSGNPIPSTIVISSTDTSSTVYPVLTDTNGASQALSIDNVTTSLSYVPSTGTLQPANLISGNIRANTGFTNADGTVQTSAYTGGAILAGSYTNTNITVNNQGKITALANGTGGGGGGTNAITAVVNTTDTTSTLYPLLSTVGALQTIYADDTTTPLSYVPFTGTLSCKTITTTKDITVNTVIIGNGGNATNLNIGTNFNGVLTTGNYNTALGNSNLTALTTGKLNQVVGYTNLRQVTTGWGNTAIGFNCGNNITTTGYNSYVGYGAGQTDTGDSNSCLGNGAKCGTFNNSTAIGVSALATADNQIMLGSVGINAPVVVMNKGCEIDGAALTTTGGITASGTQAITFGTNAPTMSGASISSSTIPITSVVGTAMDLTTNQTVGGTKIFSNTISGSINGTANTSTNITLGNAGDLLYQSGTSATAKLPIGTSSYVLTSNGSIPQWTAPGATSTPTLANVLLAGNSAGATNLNMNSKNIIGCNELDVIDIVGTGLIQAVNFGSSDLAEFNSCVVDTTLTSTGNATFNSGVILGAGAPLINSTSTTNPLVIQSGVGKGITLKTGGGAGISTTLDATGILTLAQPPVMSGASITSATIPIGAVNGTAVVLSGAQTIAGSKTFSSAIIASGGLTGTSSLATSLTGGLGGYIPYQSAVNTTSLLANGTAGQVLTSAGTTLAPTWTSSSTNASTITLANTASGTTNYLVMSTTSVGNSSLITNNTASYDATTSTANINITGNASYATTAGTANNATNATNVFCGFNNINADYTLASFNGQLSGSGNFGLNSYTNSPTINTSTGVVKANNLTLNGSGTALSGANATAVSFPSANITGNIFTGSALLGNATGNLSINTPSGGGNVFIGSQLLTGITCSNTNIAFSLQTNYGGNNMTGAAAIQAAAATDLVLRTPAASPNSIKISPLSVDALVVSSTGIATFTNSPILPITAPTNTVNQLGYIQTKVSTLTGAIVSGTYQNLVSGGFSLTPGIYSLNFYVQNTTTAVAGYVTSMLVGLSTSTTAFVAGSNNYALGCTSTPAVIGFIVGNYHTTFFVSATTTYYFGETLVYSGIVPTQAAAGTSYCQITRIG